jgi:SAM-dependent methyltransferase
MMDSKTRFSSRVADYVRYRPDYPREILSLLRQCIGLQPGWTIADIGSGTGISCRMFLENGNEVIGVEPNADMRAAAEAILAGEARFRSVGASAEATTLPEASVDLVVSAQAFHWFDIPKCKLEFNRILKPGGMCLLIWNERKLTGEFLEAYESLMRELGADYMAVRHERIDSAALDRFFASGYESADLANQQLFDLEGLIGRANSSSYAPPRDHPNHKRLIEGLRAIFARCQTDGHVAFEYATRIYYGKV